MATVKRIIVLILGLAFSAALFLVGFSPLSAAAPAGEDSQSPSISIFSTPAPQVEQVDFAAGSFPVDAKTLSLRIEKDEIPLLSRFTELETLDAQDSSCYEELLRWQEKHPQVELRYTLQLPNGTQVGNDAAALDLQGLESGDLEAVRGMLAALPALEKVELGEAKISADEILSLREAFPQVSFHYNVSLMGQKLDPEAEELDLTELPPEKVTEAVLALEGMEKLQSILLSGESGLTLEDAMAIGNAAPAAVLNYPVSLFGRDFNLADDWLDLNHVRMDDQGAAIRQLLPYMRACRVLDMDSCGVDNDNMALIRDENPNVEVIWRVNFGDNYSVRTNVTKILASKPSKGGALYDNAADQLKYCRNVRYLDLGHNGNLGNFSFLTEMPELEIAVLSMTNISDLTPLASCTHLKYLECGNTPISDLSPLAACTELKHLNVGTCMKVNDISPLYDLELKRLWLGVADPVPAEQVAEMRSRHPDCEVNTDVPSGLERDAQGNIFNEGYVLGGWKSYQNYLTSDWAYFAEHGFFPPQRPLGYFKVVYKCFGYQLADGAYSFSWNDPKFNAHGPDVWAVNTAVHNTDLLSEDWTDPGSAYAESLYDPPGEVLYELGY